MELIKESLYFVHITRTKLEIMSRTQTDLKKIADAFGVTYDAVQKALQRRKEYPNNRLVKAYDNMQAAKAAALQTSVLADR